jgi:F420-non-reducing hydrogenase iron-sulfur subunit
MTVKRITFLQELLNFMGLEGRVHLVWISSAEAQKFVQVITDFTKKIRALGPNPLPEYAGFREAGRLDSASDLAGSNPTAVKWKPAAPARQHSPSSRERI